MVNLILIAMITGMHPRETLSSTVVPYVIKFYALTHNVEITNYQVTVPDNPTDFDIGRANDQALVAKYITHDIKKSNESLVIICTTMRKDRVIDFISQLLVWILNL